MALSQLGDRPEVECPQRTGFHAHGESAFCHPARATVALDAVPHRPIHLWRPIRTGQRAVAAADAAPLIHAHQPVSVLVHGSSGTYLDAHRLGAVVARDGHVVRIAVVRPLAPLVGAPRAALVFVHLAKGHVGRQVVIVLARQHAGLATRAAASVEMEPVLFLPLLHRASPPAVPWMPAFRRRTPGGRFLHAGVSYHGRTGLQPRPDRFGAVSAAPSFLPGPPSTTRAARSRNLEPPFSALEPSSRRHWPLPAPIRSLAGRRPQRLAGRPQPRPSATIRRPRRPSAAARIRPPSAWRGRSGR